MAFDVLTMDEASRRARISSRYLSKRIAAGEGPDVFRIGRRVLVRSDALQAWLESLSRSQTPAPAVPSPAMREGVAA